MRTALRLSICSLAILVGVATAQTGSEFVDPRTLLSKSDTSLARRGCTDSTLHCLRTLWKPEPEEEWIERLRQSPPKVVAVFLMWSAMAARTSDFGLLVCFNRPLEDPERGLLIGSSVEAQALKYTIKSRVEFVDGTTDTIGSLNFGSSGGDRCGSIPEQHPTGHLLRHRWVDFSMQIDLRYRPSKIKLVAVTVSRKTKYGQEVVTQAETFIPSFHVYPTRWTKDGDVRITPEFIDGRFKGEALRSARLCKNIVVVEDIKPPAENDRSEYAQGFAVGWDLAKTFLNRDERCDELPVVFEIEQMGIKALIRAVSKCARPRQPNEGLPVAIQGLCGASPEL